MTVKIFIKRKVSTNHQTDLDVLLRKMRTLTISQPGYISGETLTRVDLRGETVVVSTWRSIQDWNTWFNSEDRMVIQTEIDQLLDCETEYAVYE